MDRTGLRGAAAGSVATLLLLALTRELCYRWVRHRMKQAGRVF